MSFSILQLKTALDHVRSHEDLEPKNGKTYCNIAVHRTLGLLGVPQMINKLTGQPLLANDMCDCLRNSPSRWVKVDGDVATARTVKGMLVLACQRLDGHGHIACVYPLPAEYSGSWGKWVPMLNNIGKKNGIMRSSQCFKTEPDYYAYKLL
jgi:hypothetical protein